MTTFAEEMKRFSTDEPQHTRETPLKCSGYINGVKVDDDTFRKALLAHSVRKSAEVPTREEVYEAMLNMHALEEDAKLARARYERLRKLRYGDHNG